MAVSYEQALDHHSRLVKLAERVGASKSGSARKRERISAYNRRTAHSCS